LGKNYPITRPDDSVHEQPLIARKQHKIANSDRVAIASVDAQDISRPNGG
jgi:hypothetical protein